MSSRKTFRRSISTLVCVAMLTGLAHWEITRIAQGKLFLFSLPKELPPSSVEQLDAKLSADHYHFPALTVIALIGLLAMWFLRKPRLPNQSPHPVPPRLAWLFGVAVTCDLVTTICFFHTHGIDFELHPGIRLFGYAYGRTAGPILGKTLQAAGLLCIATWSSQWRNTVIAIATILYLGAGAANAYQQFLLIR